MSIKFHCEHCGNKITAKDEAASKWGRCPVCHNKIYVPDLNVDVSDLKLAPIDDNEEAERKELMAETHQINIDILSLKEDVQAPPVVGKMSSYPINNKKLEIRIITYLQKMGAGKIENAKELESQITPYKQQAIKILDRIALSEIPEPELANVPPAVLSSMIKELRSKLS